MPFKSKAQQKAMYAKADKGEIDKKVVEEFSDATKKQKGGFAALPEKKAASIKNGSSKLAGMEIDVEKGDTILTGRFKNSPKIVKSFGTDSNGQPTINGMKALAFRIDKLMPKKKKEKKAMTIKEALQGSYLDWWSNAGDKALDGFTAAGNTAGKNVTKSLNFLGSRKLMGMPLWGKIGAPIAGDTQRAQGAKAMTPKRRDISIQTNRLKNNDNNWEQEQAYQEKLKQPVGSGGFPVQQPAPTQVAQQTDKVAPPPPPPPADAKQVVMTEPKPALPPKKSSVCTLLKEAMCKGKKGKGKAKLGMRPKVGKSVKKALLQRTARNRVATKLMAVVRST